MTPRYTWTPASEPPDTDRIVLAWRGTDWCLAVYVDGEWSLGSIDADLTHWRDVEPPEAKE